MNKTDMKALLKPLIKECVRECILESGVLSSIVTEVANGLSNSRILMNESHSEEVREQIQPKQKKELTLEQKEKIDVERQRVRQAGAEKQRELEEKMSKLTGFDAFKGVTPLSETQAAPRPTPSVGKADFDHQGTALRGLDPNDAGVSIKGLLNVVGGKNNWIKQVPKAKEG